MTNSNLTLFDGNGWRLPKDTYQTFSDNLYISTGLYEFFYRENGEEIRHPARFTYVVKVETAHKIKHHHSSLVPA